jgi:hypothetical protein
VAAWQPGVLPEYYAEHCVPDASAATDAVIRLSSWSDSTRMARPACRAALTGR